MRPLAKNASGERYQGMHQTRKGSQWHFGLKAHIGVDSMQGTVQSVADKHTLLHLLQGKDTKVWGDGGYQGQTEAIKKAALKAKDMTGRRTRFKQYVDEMQQKKNRTKSRVRARVEHPFRILNVSSASIRSKVPWPDQEPSPAVRQLRADQHVSPPQMSGRADPVVSGGLNPFK